MARPAAPPRPLTTFVGRTRCCAEVDHLIGRHRLVTLTGPGGGGKSRLALAVAEARERAGAGVGFVDLAPLAEADLVADAVSAACGVAGGTGPLGARLARALVGPDRLLVLDSCERVVEGCAPVVHDLLSEGTGVTVLATSREPLGVDGEVTYRVPPLDLPAVGDDPLADLRGSEAGQLFLDRAERARPGLRLTPDDARAAVAVCRRLDGLPLAIELAASRVRVQDLPDLDAALADRFRGLGEGPRTAPPRQRTLEASMAWSHDLLDDAERRLFRRLGVFAAGFTTRSAAAVSGEEDKADVGRTLAGLVDRSLVQLDESSGTTTYRLLDTVGHDARLRLAEAGEEATTRDRHLALFADVARAAGDEPVSSEGLDDAAAVLDDLRAAMDWSVASGRVDLGLQMATALRAFWIDRNRTAEGEARLAALLEAGPDVDPGTRAAAFSAAAQLAHYAADLPAADAHAGEALTLARRAGDRVTEGEALVVQAWSRAFADPAGARPRFTEGVGLLDAEGHERFVEFGQIGLGVAHLNEGDLPAAAATLSAAVERARARQSWGVQGGLALLGFVQVHRGRLGEAEALLREASRQRWGAHDRFQDDLARQGLVLVRLLSGELDVAAGLLGEGLDEAVRRGASPILGRVHAALLDLARGDAAGAAAHAASILPVLRRIGWRWLEARALAVAGDAAALAGDRPVAEHRWREAATVAEASGNPVARSFAALGLSRAAEARADRAEARTRGREALRLAMAADHRIAAVDSLERLAVLAATGDPADGDDPEDGARLLAAVDAERERIGYVRFPVDRDAFAAATDTARRRLSAGFRTAEEAGAALAFEEAAALANRGERHPPRPPSGWASLTPAELRVARLVVRGLTNPEIGEHLFISPRTVQTHLSRVFAKLEVSGRAELAAVVAAREPEAGTTA